MDIFHEAATQVVNRELDAWQAAGKKIVGYTCSSLPAEVFYAADILPVRLRGIQTDGLEIGDAYYGPFVCSFPKCILQLAGSGKYTFLDGAVMTPGCDAMRRLDECWRKANDDHPGILPRYFYFFDVPHKDEPHGLAWFVEEIKQLIKSIDEHFGIKVTHGMLKAAIHEYNKGRRLLQILETMRSDPHYGVSGTDAFAATVAGTALPREAYTKSLEEWISSLEANKIKANGRKRLMLLGSISDDVDLVALIEGSGDATVVAENLCFGVRFEGAEIPETGDPIDALADHYLGQSICPRMYGKYKERLALLKNKINRQRVDGVVMQNIRFCDLHGAENALFERDMERMGIPCLRIEREYGPLVETGRIQLRLKAFLERIA